MTGPGREQVLPTRAPARPGPVSPLYITARTSWLTLREGSPVVLRPAVPEDRALLVEAFERLSPESRYRRFFAPLRAMSTTLLDYLTSIDYVDHFAWAALARRPGLGFEECMGVGVARYVRLADPTAAEVAVTVVDDWQGRGLGGILLDALVLEALQKGITRFEGDVLVENRPMQELLRRTGAAFRPEEPGVLRFSIDLPARDEGLGSRPFADLLRALARGEAALYQSEPCPWLSGLKGRSGLEGEERLGHGLQAGGG